jgi:predicted ribosome quality control (RQC) complex YloA/Tae2 family protein
MALDGIVISNLVYELNNTILNKKISKIAQPENDELLFTVKGDGGQYRLAMSASASLPFLYLTSNNKPSPLTAPNFCMVLRKHIANGRITRIYQPHMERIINFEIEHLDEMGDLCTKTLVVELMGKHSNIIFCNSDGMIIDSIKHVSSMMSSLREVLPGRSYCIPATQENKLNPLEVTEEAFMENVMTKPVSITKAIYTSFTGISPVIASEICYRASIDGDMPVDSLDVDGKKHLFNNFNWMMDDVKHHNYCPNIVIQGKEPVDFSSFQLSEYMDTAVCASSNAKSSTQSQNGYHMTTYDSISQVLEEYYASKNVYTRIRQKSVDLRKIVTTALDRNRKKYQLQEKQLKDTEKREKYKVYGELIHTYGYGLQEGAKELEALNYYTNENIRIPLDPTLDAKTNAQKYFDKYNKLKRTYEALTELIQETQNEIHHLESISTSLDIALTEDDLVQIKEELMEYGYIRRKRSDKKAKVKSKPFHYLSSDGYHIYVGKNNYQNEELTFKFATGNDWWFHAKGIPGSHVIVKSNNEELPDRVFEEAGKLAGYYSSGRDSDKIEIDYLQKKNVKKPNGSAPGFVVYYTNYSLTIHPDITELTLLES